MYNRKQFCQGFRAAWIWERLHSREAYNSMSIAAEYTDKTFSFPWKENEVTPPLQTIFIPKTKQLKVEPLRWNGP